MLLSSHFPELAEPYLASPAPRGSLARVRRSSRARSPASLGALGLHWTRLSARGILGVVVFFLLVPSRYPGGQDSQDYDSQTPERVSGHVAGKAVGRGPGRCSAAVCDTRSPRAASAPREPGMVRAGAVASHLPASGLDIFGDLRKMNKRQVTESRVGGASGSRDRLRQRGVGAPRMGLPLQGQRPATGAGGDPRLPPWALGGPGFKSAQTHVWALSCTDKSSIRGGWPGRGRE